MTVLLNHLPALTNQVRRIALRAGDATLEHFSEAGYAGVADIKDDNSPLTLADTAAHNIILEGLRKIVSNVKIVSEEGTDSQEGDLENYLWLVDPLDGTRGFLKGDKDYTVNIALIKNHTPILGVVYAPALGELYAASVGDKAIKWNEDTETEKEIHVRNLIREGLTVFISNHEGATPKRDEFFERFKIEKMVKRSSSIKHCKIAEGKGDLSIRFGEICEWDLAASQCVLEVAGGKMTDWEDRPLRYDVPQNPRRIFQGYVSQNGQISLEV